MLYETLLQGAIFLALFYSGLFCGVFFEIKKMLDKMLKHWAFILITDILFFTISAFLFVFAENLFNYGEFRFYLLLAFVLGTTIEHFSVGFLVEKFFIIIYNLINRVVYLLKIKIKKVFKNDRKTGGNFIKSN